jgi:hypothetical protein
MGRAAALALAATAFASASQLRANVHSRFSRSESWQQILTMVNDHGNMAS